jgi:hypothetical protein
LPEDGAGSATDGLGNGFGILNADSKEEVETGEEFLAAGPAISSSAF